MSLLGPQQSTASARKGGLWFSERHVRQELTQAERRLSSGRAAEWWVSVRSTDGYRSVRALIAPIAVIPSARGELGKWSTGMTEQSLLALEERIY